MGTRCYVTYDDGLKREILKLAHSSAFSMHPNINKIYRTLREFFWWTRMKREISVYEAKCLDYQKMKAKRYKSSGLLKSSPILW